MRHSGPHDSQLVTVKLTDECDTYRPRLSRYKAPVWDSVFLFGLISVVFKVVYKVDDLQLLILTAENRVRIKF